MRKTNIKETYVYILQTIYFQATDRIHLDKLVSDDFPGNKGDLLSPKLFTTVFKKADISAEIDVDGETLTNLGFVDDVALFNEKQNKWKNT